MTDKRNRADVGAGKAGMGGDHVGSDKTGKRRTHSGLDERWLEQKVRDMYQEVVNEPVPDDILKILNRIPRLG